MNVVVQIGTGTALLVISALLHIALSAKIVGHLKRHQRLRNLKGQMDLVRLVSLIFATFVLSHTAHVYLWAFVFWLVGALPGYEEPIYFALVTYTTLGYGDVTLDAQFRILGAMASVTGILMFGLTTAFLVGVFSRVLRVEYD